MCGIWGYVGRESSRSTVPIEDVWTGLCALTDRGPDDWGLYTDVAGKTTEEEDLPSVDCAVALGNRRLSILDLSAAGNQPMVVDDRYWIVYNGEVYNYRELRTDLRAKGYTFESDTDTEVVLRAYQEYGTDCVERFRGMFAFAIWDTAAERLFAARDRFGIKPLYYDADSERITFASEITSLLDGDVTEPELDHEAVDGFLALGSVPTPRTILRDVRSVPPGSTLTYEQASGECQIRQYWQPDFADDEDTETDLTNRVRNLLLESVELRMRSDVPVGAFLSGGLDSSAIVAAMTAVRDSNESLHTFSIDFDDEEHSEGTFAQEVAEDLGTEHHARTVTAADVREHFPAIVRGMDQPTVDGINTYFVSHFASEAGLRVALSGLGSDELFYGYPTFHQVPRLTRAATAMDAFPHRFQSGLATVLDRVAGIVPATYARSVADVLRSRGTFGAAYATARGLFTRRQREQLVDGWSPVDWGAEIDEESGSGAAGNDVSDAVSRTELSWYMHNQLLRDTDVMSMTHSLEVRVPFLDAELAEFVATIPSTAKEEGQKALLKDAVREIVPATTLERDKSGFTFPFDRWLSDQLEPVVDESLSERALAGTPLDYDAAQRIRQEYERGDVHWSRLWALVVLSQWVNEHVPDSVAEPNTCDASEPV